MASQAESQRPLSAIEQAMLVSIHLPVDSSKQY